MTDAGDGWTEEVVKELMTTPSLLRSPGMPLVVLFDGVNEVTNDAGAHTVLRLPELFPGRLTVMYTSGLVDRTFLFTKHLNNRCFTLFASSIEQKIATQVSICFSAARFCVFLFGSFEDAYLDVTPQPAKPVELPTLPKRVLARIAEARFEIFNKRLDQQQLDLLLANPGSQNLRWLNIACEELRMHGLCVLRRYDQNILSCLRFLVQVHLRL